MRPFDVGSITETDLLSLVEAKPSEGRALEFKAQLPGRTESERKEFLADVTSFANAQGGVILYGVTTSRDSQGRSTGIAEALAGLRDFVSDREIQRLEAMLRDGVDPPLSTQVRFQEITRSTGDPPVLALGVFRSFAGPHQVTYAGSRRFWLRGQTGKYQPDVSELRYLFSNAASWLRQVDDVRRERLVRLRSLPRLNTSSSTIVHVLPLAPSEALIDLRAHQARLNAECPPLQHAGWSQRYNTDGYMTFCEAQPSREIFSYTQWFRTGGVEGYSSEFVAERNDTRGTPIKMLWLKELKAAVLEWAPKAIALLQNPLQVEPPYALLLSLQGVQGAHVPGGGIRFTSHAIDWPELILPVVLYEPSRDDLSAVLQPLFDTIAQSAGLATAG